MSIEQSNKRTTALKLLLTEIDDETRYPNWFLRLLIANVFTGVAYALSGADVWDNPSELKYGKILPTYFFAFSLIQEYIFTVFIFLARRYFARGRKTFGLVSVFVLCCIVPTAAITVTLMMYLRTVGLEVVDIPPFKTEPLFLWQTTIILTSIYACCYFKQRFSKGSGGNRPKGASGIEN